MMRVAAVLGILWSVLALAPAPSAQPEPAGLWNFDDPEDLLRADIGADLVLVGSHESVPGSGPTDGAARINAGSHYICLHGILPNGGGMRVNEYTVVLDLRTFGRGLWHSLFQTHPQNADSAEVYINGPGSIGTHATGYSFPRMLDARTWYRIAIVVDNCDRFEVYGDTFPMLCGTPQLMDGRHALRDSLLFFADPAGLDGEIDISRIALYDGALTPQQVAELGGLGGCSHFLTPPFLQNAKPDGISIMWETEQLEDTWVAYGTDSTYGSEGIPAAVDSESETWIYTAVLTGLQPATTYRYRVFAGEAATEESCFETSPAEAVDFSFAVWGDSQGTNRQMYNRDPTEPTRAIFEHMREQNVKLGVGVGDLAEDGASYTDTRMYHLDRAMAIMGTQVPLYFAWGNHDGHEDTVVLRKFADLPSRDRGAPFHAGYGSYSFDYGGCHFICIDWLVQYDDIPGWVEEDLQSPAAEEARYTFLFIHYAPYMERWHVGYEYLQTHLVPLLEHYGVDVCFAGHLHEYERGYLNGVFYVISGNTCWLCHICPMTCDWPHMTMGGFHDLAPDIDGGLIDGYLVVDVTEDLLSARLHTFYADGTYREILDSFSKPGGYCDVDEPPRWVPATAITMLSPNPYLPPAGIYCRVPWPEAQGSVTLRIYAPDGRLVRILGQSCSEGGRASFVWDGCDGRGIALPAAVYFTRLEAGPQRARGRLLMIR